MFLLHFHFNLAFHNCHGLCANKFQHLILALLIYLIQHHIKVALVYLMMMKLLQVIPLGRVCVVKNFSKFHRITDYVVSSFAHLANVVSFIFNPFKCALN